MTKEVLIEIKSTISSDGEVNEIKTCDKGNYYDKDNSIYILYEEDAGDGSKVKSRIKLSGNQVELKKQGSYTTQMIFDPEKRTRSTYSTPYGIMSFDIKTDELITDVKSDAVSIMLKYALLSGTDTVSEHKLNIIIKPAI